MSPLKWLLLAELVLLVAAFVGVRVGSEWSPRRSVCALLVVLFATALAGTLGQVILPWLVEHVR